MRRGEARQIWIWWSDCHDMFYSLSTVLRLLALVQTPSARTERLFSVLTLVVEAIGETMLEVTLETLLSNNITFCVTGSTSFLRASLRSYTGT